MANLHAPGWVAAGIRQGLSAAAALRDYRAAGGSIRDAVWRKLYAEQKASVGNSIDEITKPLNSTPNAQEIFPMTTKKATGYLQTVEIYTRLKGTDIVTSRSFMLSGDTLMTRSDALSKALTQMQQAADEGRYDEVILGGVYTGTRVMTPGEVQ